MEEITLKSDIKLGVVPTHIKFVGGIVPNENGNLPRNENGELKIVAELADLKKTSPVKIDTAQISIFPGVTPKDNDDLFNGINNLGMKPESILMLAGGNPMNPDDEDKVCAMLVDGIKTAVSYGCTEVSSTSIEEWMAGGAPITGKDYEQATQQLVKLHTRVLDESGGHDSLTAWHLEWLRGIEFQTFTNIHKGWELAQALNQNVGKNFFKVLVDAAHCGDSGLSKEANIEAIKAIGAADGFSMFHASTKTTRGCLSTSDGWIEDLLTACAETGKLKTVFVELFHHEDAALEGLRNAVEGHGADTMNGRSYSEAVRDGLALVANHINNL